MSTPEQKKERAPTKKVGGKYGNVPHGMRRAHKPPHSEKGMNAGRSRFAYRCWTCNVPFENKLPSKGEYGGSMPRLVTVCPKGHDLPVGYISPEHPRYVAP